MTLTKERIREMIDEFSSKKVVRKCDETDIQFKRREAKERKLIEALAANTKAYEKAVHHLLRTKRGEKRFFFYIQGVLNDKGLELRENLGIRNTSSGGHRDVKNQFNRNYKKKHLRMKK